MKRALAGLLLLALASLGCFRTTYTHVYPRQSPPHMSDDPERAQTESWRHYFVHGTSPESIGVRAGAACGGPEHIDRIDTEKTGFQSLVAFFAGTVFNVYAPFSARVVCDHSMAMHHHLLRLTGQAPPRRPPIENSREYAADFESVWQAAIRAVAERGLDIARLDRKSGLIAVRDLPFRESQIVPEDLGPLGELAVKQREAAMNIYVRPLERNRTGVEIYVAMRTRVRLGDRLHAYPVAYRWRESLSNGALEASLLEGVGEQLRYTHDWARGATR